MALRSPDPSEFISQRSFLESSGFLNDAFHEDLNISKDISVYFRHYTAQTSDDKKHFSSNNRIVLPDEFRRNGNTGLREETTCSIDTRDLSSTLSSMKISRISIEKYRKFNNHYLPAIGSSIRQSSAVQQELFILPSCVKTTLKTTLDSKPETPSIQKCDVSEPPMPTKQMRYAKDFSFQESLKEEVSLTEEFKLITKNRGHSSPADLLNDPNDPLTSQLPSKLTLEELKTLYRNHSDLDYSSLCFDCKEIPCTQLKAIADDLLTKNNEESFNVETPSTETFEWVAKNFRYPHSVADSDDLKFLPITGRSKYDLTSEGLKTLDQNIFNSYAPSCFDLECHQTNCTSMIATNNESFISNGEENPSLIYSNGSEELKRLIILHTEYRNTLMTFKPFLQYYNDLTTILENESFNTEKTAECFPHHISAIDNYILNSKQTNAVSRNTVKHRLDARNSAINGLPSTVNEDLQKLLNETGVLGETNLTSVPLDACLESDQSPSMISFLNHEESYFRIK